MVEFLMYTERNIDEHENKNITIRKKLQITDNFSSYGVTYNECCLRTMACQLVIQGTCDN